MGEYSNIFALLRGVLAIFIIQKADKLFYISHLQTYVSRLSHLKYSTHGYIIIALTQNAQSHILEFVTNIRFQILGICKYMRYLQFAARGCICYPINFSG